jgi:histidine ammonia-lyase
VWGANGRQPSGFAARFFVVSEAWLLTPTPGLLGTLYIGTMPHAVILDGDTLTIDDVVAVARWRVSVEVACEATERVQGSRAALEDAVRSGASLYGVNTGFGKLAHVRIQPDQLAQLQRNLIVSHVAGVGDALPAEDVRAIMLLRANVLLRETSGVRPVLAQRLAEMLNAGIHPVVPEQGSVGASGDLAPLSHVAYALIGEGEVDVGGGGPPEPSGQWQPSRRLPAAAALREAGLEPVTLQAKEGLAFINGTQVQSAILSLLVHDARLLWRTAHGAAAMSLEALRGTPVPFDERIHAVRPHPGQVASAALLRELLAGSEIRESHRIDDPRVQDAYSLRCTPQILGPVMDAVEYAAGVLAVELNASTDNPLVFGTEVLSGGNFHGQPVAFALDMLGVALTTLAGVAERRIDRILNPDTSQGLPAFLAPDPGLQSGFMMAQITAAALAAECRTLCTPACVQSIPTDGGQEDYVPMGVSAALKCRRILANVQRVVAIELLVGAQGIEHWRPLRAGEGVERLHARVRDLVSPLEDDRPLTPDIERLATVVRGEKLI